MQISTLIRTMIVSMSIICSCTSELRRPAISEFANKSNIYKILYFASLAGSSHNSQPWKVEVSGNNLIRLYVDTTRELSMVDSKRRELYISLGAFIENLTLAAENMGYQTTINIITDQFQKRSLVAEIHLDKAPTTGYDLRIIEKRMTLRTPFKTNSIKENDIKELLSSDPQSIRFFSSSSREGSFIAQKTIEAYEQQAFNKAVQNELATWIRFSDEDVKEKKDGLTTAGMQINGFRGFIVRHFLKPEDSKRESFIKGGIKKTKDQVHYCGGWIIIITHGNSVANWIKAGRLYQHINLTCTQLKIGFQPMNQIIEEDNFKKEVAEYFGVKEEIVFLARIGYVSNIPEPVSPRRPVEAFAQFNK